MREEPKEDGGDNLESSAVKEECNANSDVCADKNAGTKMTDISKAVQALALHDAQSGASAPRTLQDARGRKYKFWDTQPVPKISELI